MSDRPAFEVQGHRGARGLRPENTLCGFEVALDLGVSSIETDVHLTHDGVPVLCHDAAITGRLCSPAPVESLPISGLTLAELRGFRVDRSPDPQRFPDQVAEVGPFARTFADARGIDPLGIPTMSELLAFAVDYTEEPGKRAGKNPAQQQKVRRVVLDFELKRVPYLPANIGDAFDGTTASILERRIAEEAITAGMLDRVRIRSFDHRCLWAIRELESRLQTAVLIANTAPVRPGDLVDAAGAELYCPDYNFVDAEVVRQVHAANKRIVPWTVNYPPEWNRLVKWGVDGITTDFPDQLIKWLRKRRIPVK
jgi:glycerophosphoryl diester phosphodiesterase